MIVNFNTKINAELNDITATLLLSFFIGWKQDIQFWKQEDISQKLGIPLSTTKKKLKELKENQFITFNAQGRNTAKRTKFVLLEKAKKYMNDISQPSKPSTLPLTRHGNEKPLERNQQKANIKNMYDMYDEIMAKMKKEGLA